MAAWGPDRLDIFVRGTDNALWHLWWDGKWNSWESLGGVLTSGPGAAALAPGYLVIYVKGTDQAIWFKVFTP